MSQIIQTGVVLIPTVTPLAPAEYQSSILKHHFNHVSTQPVTINKL